MDALCEAFPTYSPFTYILLSLDITLEVSVSFILTLQSRNIPEISGTCLACRVSGHAGTPRPPGLTAPVFNSFPQIPFGTLENLHAPEILILTQIWAI